MRSRLTRRKKNVGLYHKRSPSPIFHICHLSFMVGLVEMSPLAPRLGVLVGLLIRSVCLIVMFPVVGCMSGVVGCTELHFELQSYILPLVLCPPYRACLPIIHVVRASLSSRNHTSPLCTSYLFLLGYTL
jgi:hypothetical protein